MKTRITSFAIILCLFIGIFTLSALALSGGGTEDDPYLISEAADMAKIHDDLNGYYQLTDNIDMTDVVFTPIGNAAEIFTGTIDGNGYSISNLHIYLPNNEYVGLIGYLQGCIRNLDVKNSTIYGKTDAGGIVGYAYNSEISNCTFSGTVSCSNNNSVDTHAGGIVGNLSNSSVSYCTNNGSISSLSHNPSSSGSAYAGGIAGSISSSAISSCINTGSIAASASAGSNISCSGGIVGYTNSSTLLCVSNSGSVSATISSTATSEKAYSGGIMGASIYSSTISNAFNSGSIYASSTGDASTGGIMGENQSTYSTILTHCLNIGKVHASAHNANNENGIAGTHSATNFSNCYSLRETGKTSFPLSYDKFKNMQSFSSFNFNNTWYADQKTSSGFPQLLDMPKHIDLNECLLMLEFDKTSTLSAAIDGISEEVTWSTDNKNIATVSADGKVTAVSSGFCTVTATNNDGMKANCLVYVYTKAQSISIADASVNVKYKIKLNALQTPSTANEMIIWESSDTGIATVETDGTVTGTAVGNVTITATGVLSGIKGECTVTVIGEPITRITLSSSSTVNVGSSIVLNPTITPTQYKGTLTWSSADESIATVENGIVTGISNGITDITVVSDTGCRASCTVTVKSSVTALKLNKKFLTLEKGYTEKLIVLPTPEDTTDTFTWSSSNSSCVKVADDGTVTAVANGTAIITVTASSGIKAYCTVTVVASTVSVDSITLNKTEAVIKKADTMQLVATILPSNATNTDITWTSSDEEVASVNTLGVVTALSHGITTVRATAANGVYSECLVKVISPSGSAIVISDAYGENGDTVTLSFDLQNNPGISACKLAIEYDATLLTPILAEKGEGFDGTVITHIEDGIFNVLWYSANDTNVCGEMFKLTFEIAESASLGSIASIGATYGANDICNTAGDSLAFYVDSGTVTVRQVVTGDIYENGEITVYDLTLLARYITYLEEFTARQIKASDFTGDGEIDIRDVVALAQYIVGYTSEPVLESMSAEPMSITVASVDANETEAIFPVEISGNRQIAGFNLEVVYDENAIEIIDIIPNDTLCNGYFITNLGYEADNGLYVTWYNNESIETNGPLFTIEARVINTDGDLSISILPRDNNFCNEVFEKVLANYTLGGFIQSLIGDLSGDGKITIVDCMLLAKAVVNNTSINGGDITGDGKITMLDIIRLLKLFVNV